MKVNKDLYEYIMYFADDDTIINMLSVNKKFNNSEIFKRILETKYKNLLQFKDEEMTWRQFFVSISFFFKTKDYTGYSNNVKSAILSKNINLLKYYLDQSKKGHITQYHSFYQVENSFIEFLKEKFPISKYYILNKLLNPVIETKYVTKSLLTRIFIFYILENDYTFKFNHFLKLFEKNPGFKLKNINSLTFPDLYNLFPFLLKKHKFNIKNETVIDLSYLSKFLVFHE